MIRFFIALWASKFYLFVQKIFHKEQSDRAGLLAARICPSVLSRVAKPKLVIGVTGTNGKTTITHLVYDVLKKKYKKIGFNEWNANMRAGFIRCFIDSVNIFNKPNKELVLLEMDEKTADETFPEVKPDYLIVTNLFNDSIRRNSYPEYILNRLDKGVSSCNVSLVLNADDPLSSSIGKDNKKVFVSVCELSHNTHVSNSLDFQTCNRCHHKVDYIYRQYRQIGRYVCPNCGEKSKDADYYVSKVGKDYLLLNDKKYPLLSSKIHNIYNEVSLIALLYELGYDYDFICSSIKNISISKTRENDTFVNGINIYGRLSKAQNGSSISTVLESLISNKRKKDLIFILDEHLPQGKLETITWLYDTDFELLNKLNIRKVYMITDMISDYELRFQIAGLSKDDYMIVHHESEIYDDIKLDKDVDMYVMFDLDHTQSGKDIINELKERAKRI